MSDEEKNDPSDEKEEEEALSGDGDGSENRKKRLEKGDYMILVHLIQARELKGVDFGATSDPMCEVKVMQQKKNSTTVKEQQTLIWDERFQFSFPNLDPEELNIGKCTISCFDANLIRRNVLIGRFEFDLVSIYYKENHELYKQWIALTDVTDKREGVQGYLQVSIMVLGPGDEEYVHPESEELDLEGSLLNVMMPPQIDPDPWLLRVIVYKMEKLPIMDKLSKSSDPYAMVEFAGVKEKTEHASKKLNYDVMTTVNIPVMEPVLSDSIYLYIKDWDIDSLGNTDRDDLIGLKIFSWRKVREEGIDCRYFHMYGAPPGEDKGKLADKMNRGIKEGVWYRGSVLVRLNARSEDEPKKGIVKDAAWNSALAPENVAYALQIDCYMGTEIKNNKGKYAIEMRCREAYWRTPFTEATNRGTLEWYDVLTDEGVDPTKQDYIRLFLPKDLTQCPDMIFYVVQQKDTLSLGKGVKYISYRRFKFAELFKHGWECKPQWYDFNANRKLTKLDETEYPGTVLMGIRLGMLDELPKQVSLISRPFLNLGSQPDYLSVESLEREPSLSGQSDTSDIEAPLISPNKQSQRAPKQTVGVMNITILRADNVPITDRDGLSDPYVTLEINGKEEKTAVKKDTLTPQWNETFQFKAVSIYDEFTLELRDHNKFSRAFVIGRKENISLTSLMREGKRDEKGWNITKKILISQEYPTCTLSISVQFKFDAKQAAKRKDEERRRNRGGFLSGLKSPKNKTTESSRRKGKELMGSPYTKNYQLLLYVYVARDVPAADNNGLADPYLVVSYCGVKVKTKTHKNTLNPQFMEILKMNVEVPQPAEFAPKIRVLLYDHDMGGPLNPDDLLSKFYIPFTDVLSMMKQEKANWYDLLDPKGNNTGGKVYIAAEFIDPNRRRDPIFNIDTTTNKFYLHLLTLGVRNLKSGFGVSKPQIVYALPVAGETQEVTTDPSSNPEPKNANFLVTKKVVVKCPTNYELAPVLNIVCRDHKFGGLFKNDIATTSLNLQRFMEQSKDPKSVEWTVKEGSKNILNEKELATEMSAEFDAETRVTSAEERVRALGIRKIKEMIETRTSQRLYDEVEIKEQNALEAEELKILDENEIEEILAVRDLAASGWKPKPKIPSLDDESAMTSDIGSDSEVISTEQSVIPDESDEEETEESLEIKYDKMETETGEIEMEEKDGKEDEEALLLKKQKTKEAELKTSDGQPMTGQREQTSLDDIKNEDASTATGDVPKGKEKSEKSKGFFAKIKAKKEQEAKLKAWDEQDADLCYDLDSKVSINLEDFLPEYLKGRKRVSDDLEDVMNLQPFDQIGLWTGSVGGLKLFGMDRRQVGSIKGLWKLSPFNEEINPFGKGLKNLVQQRTISCRLYILEGIHLFATDSDNSSDPYLIIKLGRNKQSTRKRYIKNTLDPKFHEFFEFHTNLPGASQVEVECWDWDGIGDDLIGRTIIDIENRWFSKDWRRLRLKPLEERNLYNPRSKSTYGKLLMWVDLMSKDDARIIPPVDISLPPVDMIEFRIIVWKAKECVIKDTTTDQNDLRVTVNLKSGNEKKQQETDTHWRAKFGKGSWNWRILFDVPLPIDKRSMLNMSIWDQDVFAASDSIGETNISLDILFKQMYKQRVEKPRLILRKDATKRFWLDFTHPNFEGVQAQVQVSMELMTKDESDKFPAGIGRTIPNSNPFLPPPEGRLAWTWNPISMLRQLLGDKCCFKLYLVICALACAAIIVFAGPQLVMTLISNLIASILGV